MPRCCLLRLQMVAISFLSSVPMPTQASASLSESIAATPPRRQPFSCSSASSIAPSASASSPSPSTSCSVSVSSPCAGSQSALTHMRAARLKSPESSSLRAAASGVPYLDSKVCTHSAMSLPSMPASSRMRTSSSVPIPFIASLRRHAIKAGLGSSIPCSISTSFFFGLRSSALARDSSCSFSYRSATKRFCSAQLPPMISMGTCSLKSENIPLSHCSCSASTCSAALASSTSPLSSRSPLRSLKMRACRCLYSLPSSSLR
mmetsp:Transcript_35351/g.84492  ORF Transcript_35351/g.84492 Transcript_35351/m.84492 type:complete len:261 (+) Transcript_35351:1724-2506(+)